MSLGGGCRGQAPGILPRFAAQHSNRPSSEALTAPPANHLPALPPPNDPAAEQRHLQVLYRRCQTPDDLDKALKLTRLNYLVRLFTLDNRSIPSAPSLCSPPALASLPCGSATAYC